MERRVPHHSHLVDATERVSPAEEFADKTAYTLGIPKALERGLIQQESGWDPNATSGVGAHGYTQLMPGTASSLGVNINDPYQNILGGLMYLAQQYRRFHSWPLALAAYNAGPGAVEKYNDIPPYAETQNYVRAILGAMP